MPRLSDNPSVPVHGWRCVSANDLGGRTGHCEMCGGAIRYVHLMEHKHFHRRVEAGANCAEEMCGGHLDINRERMKRRAELRATWLSRHWKKTGDGRPYVFAFGVRIVLYPRRGGDKRAWGYRVGEAVARRSYASAKEAAFAAFDALWTQVSKDHR